MNEFLTSPVVSLSLRRCSFLLKSLHAVSLVLPVSESEAVQLIIDIDFILHYWPNTVGVHPAIVITIIIIAYGVVNLFAVKWYGETEFWMALGKVVLIVGLLLFTFVTMLGGNPLGDRFGFRYWDEPVSFTSYHTQYRECLTYPGLLCDILPHGAAWSLYGLPGLFHPSCLHDSRSRLRQHGCR